VISATSAQNPSGADAVPLNRRERVPVAIFNDVAKSFLFR